MADERTCQRCGAIVGPEATQGLCPACLLQEALRDSQAATLPSVDAGNSPADLAELGRLFPQLEVLALVGRGGMGVVYKARQRGLDRLVALKILPPQVDRDPGFRERFVREARALARLNHPNIVSVYDFGQVDGRYYFLMEFVDGANLRAALQGGQLKPQEAMAIVPQLCDALQFAHEEGIVHRDIKPENILLDRKGRVKIADFGLAKLLGASVQQDPYTLTGPRQVLGTPHYMAPEQFEHPGTVDHRADIYSMGVVFYEMLTGELPLGRFPPPSRSVQVDVRLDEVVLRTLEKSPEQRYQRAGQVKTELASLATLPPDGGPPSWSARAAGPPQALNMATAGGPPRISRMAIAGLLAALAFPAAGAVLGLMFVAHPGPLTDKDQFVVTEIAAMWGIFSAVLSCAFGLDAIRRIRRSGGRLYGLRLALTDALLYPLLAYDLMVVRLLMVLIEPQPMVDGRIALLLFLGTLGMDVFFVRRIWKRISRPLPAVPPPLSPPGQYALLPARRLGCLIIPLGIGVVMLALFLGLLVPYIQQRRQRQMPATLLAEGRPSISIDNAPQSNLPAGSHEYVYEIQCPANLKATLWVEVWTDGKSLRLPGFASTQWVIPQGGRPFIGKANFQLVSRSSGKMNASWEIRGNEGSSLTGAPIPYPLDSTVLNDSSEGLWWSATPEPGHAVQILALRGDMHQLLGQPTDERLIGRAKAELRVFARFDPLTPDDLRAKSPFGQSEAMPNDGKTSNPSTAPAGP